MPRTIVRIQESFDGKSFFYLESPRSYNKATTAYDLRARPSDTPFLELRTGDGSPERVMQAGERLYAEISEHPAIKDALSAALQQLELNPICFRLDDVVDADQLPWEAFRAGANEFVALNKRWPIVRLRETTESTPRTVYEFAAPIRIVAVLSAAGSSVERRAPAAPQWASIRHAIEQHRQRPGATPIELTVLTCELELRDIIGTANLPDVMADLIADKEDLIRKIRDRGPQLLHFFCHGTSEETPHLQIGTHLDWQAGQDPSIALEAGELRQRADPEQNVWLVTLNCCESALRAKDARSLANSMVAKGFPAALGMREVIDVQTAHQVCSLFYPAALQLIDAAQAGQVTEIEWAAALYEARAGLVNLSSSGTVPQNAARSCKSWTIPVLYSRREAILIKRIPGVGISPAKARIIDFIRVLQLQRAKASEDYKDLPQEALVPLLQEIDNKIAQKVLELQATP
jgi:hypothetical protein